MEQIIWNGIITAIITFTGVLLNWFLLRYKVEPILIAPSQHLKDTMKRIGKRLAKGMLYGLAIFLSFAGPVYPLYSELSQDKPITKPTLVMVSVSVFLFTSAFCLHIVFYFFRRFLRLAERHVDATGVVIDHVLSLAEAIKQPSTTESDKSQT